MHVPDAYVPLLEDLRLLRSDENNPNRMTDKQKEQIWRSLQKYGWTYPIVTNMDGVFADGEQRAEVCLIHKEFYAPVLRLPVSDVDRRMLRQVLNKLKGKHSRDIDAQEFAKIIQAGERDDLLQLLHSVGEKLPDELERLSEKVSASVPETYELIIECKDESDQKAKFLELQAKAWKVRVLNI